jgi:uncharacterized Rossmann fold enzyme
LRQCSPPSRFARPAAAEAIDSPECRRDLAMANRLIEAVAGRENSVRPGDFAGLCRLLRQNLQDMTKAREPMNRCLTGHAHGENVGQMDASIADIRDVLARRCAGQ